MKRDDDRIGGPAGFGDLTLHAALLQPVHQISPALRRRNAIGALGIGQERQPQAVLLHEAQARPVCFGLADSRIFDAQLTPVPDGRAECLLPAVEGVVVGHRHDVDPGFLQCIRRFLRGVEGRVVGEAEGRTACHTLLIGHSDIGCPELLLHRLQHRLEVEAAALPRVLIQRAVDEHISDSRQGHQAACRDWRPCWGKGGAFAGMGRRTALKHRGLGIAAAGDQKEQGRKHAAASKGAPPFG